MFVTECRYNESDKVIRKMKGLKVRYSIPFLLPRDPGIRLVYYKWYSAYWPRIKDNFLSLPLSNSSCLPQPLLMRFTSSVKRYSH